MLCVGAIFQRYSRTEDTYINLRDQCYFFHGKIKERKHHNPTKYLPRLNFHVIWLTINEGLGKNFTIWIFHETYVLPLPQGDFQKLD